MLRIACIPVYDEERVINDIVKRSLQFVDQVVVCDDGSTDNTLSIIQEISKNRVLKMDKWNYWFIED